MWKWVLSARELITYIYVTVHLTRKIPGGSKWEILLLKSPSSLWSISLDDDAGSMNSGFFLSYGSLHNRSSRFPAPRTSAVKFVSHCSQLFAGAHVQIIWELIGTVEVKVLTTRLCLGQTRRTSSVECDRDKRVLLRTRMQEIRVGFCTFFSVKTGLDAIFS